MQLFHSTRDELAAKFCADANRQKVMAPIAVAQGCPEGTVQPVRHVRSTSSGEFPYRNPVLDRKYTGNDGCVYSGPLACVTEPEIGFGLKKELGDGGLRARVQFALQPVNVRAGVGRVWMRVGVGAYTDPNAGNVLKCRDQFAGVPEPRTMGMEFGFVPRRIAAECQNFANTRLRKSPCLCHDLVT